MKDRDAHTDGGERPGQESLLARFEASMTIDFEKWHDGIGYDLGLLDEMNEGERRSVEARLLTRGVQDWRDVEALARLATPGALAALRQAMTTGSAEIRLAVGRAVPHLLTTDDRTLSLVKALETSAPFAGLSAAIDEAAAFHPPAVREALWRGLSTREGEVAVHFAALLAYIEGLAAAPFDWDLRPFFLTFHTEDREMRAAAIAELRRRIKATEGSSPGRGSERHPDAGSDALGSGSGGPDAVAPEE